MISELRAVSLLLSPYAPEQTKAYLRAVAAENDGFKFKAVRPFSATIARVAPQELAAPGAAGLIEPQDRRSQGGPRPEPGVRCSYSAYLPPSTAKNTLLDRTGTR